MKKTFAPIAILATVALLLSACVNPRAKAPGVWYNPISYWDSVAKTCLYQGTEYPVGSEVEVRPGWAKACEEQAENGYADWTSAYRIVATETAGIQPTQPPSIVPTEPAPEPTARPAMMTGECKKDSLTASHDDNLVSGRYEMSYFGGSSEACYMFGEFNFGVEGQTWLIVIPPTYTFNLAGFVGETMWYRESEGAVAWSIKDSTANLTRPDGRNEKTPIVVWVNDTDSLKLLPKVAEFVVLIPPLGPTAP